MRPLQCLALIAAALVVGACSAPWTVVGVSEADKDVIVRVQWSEGHRDLLLKASADGELLTLPAAPNDPQLLVLDPSSCAVRASTDLVRETNWFNLVEGTSPESVPDNSVSVVDNAKSLSPGEFAQLDTDSRCAGR